MALMTRLKRLTAFQLTAGLLTAGLLTAGVSGRVALAQPATGGVQLNSETFARIHQRIRPQPGESCWMGIAWLTDLHDARQKAAAEGKPLFLMVSGKGISIGMC